MIDRAAALAALRRELDGAAFDQATVLDVRDAGLDGFVVRVRWARRHPTYAIVVPADAAGLGTDLFTGGEHDGDAAEWAMSVRYWLMEELDTGLIDRGVRTTLADGSVAIDPTAEVPPRTSPWDISEVPLVRPTADAERELRRRAGGSGTGYVVTAGDVDVEPDPDPGAVLQHVGLDPAAGRRCHHAGRLIGWFALRSDDTLGAEVLGQIVVAWAEDAAGTARLEHLEVLDGTAPEAATHLVRVTVGTAADVGARWLAAPADTPGLDEAGFAAADPSGQRRLDLTDLP